MQCGTVYSPYQNWSEEFCQDSKLFIRIYQGIYSLSCGKEYTSNEQSFYSIHKSFNISTFTNTKIKSYIC